MRKSLLFILLIGICLVANLPSVKAGGIQVGFFNLTLPDSPMIYEDGRAAFSWSVNGNLPSGAYLELLIESKVDNIASFDNNSTSLTSNWQGQSYIVPKLEGEFTLKVKVWRNGSVYASRDVKMKIESNTVYSLDGEDQINVGVKAVY